MNHLVLNMQKSPAAMLSRPRKKPWPASPEVMAAFFVGGVMETAQSWLKRGRQLGEEELKEQLGALLNHFYMSASAR